DVSTLPALPPPNVKLVSVTVLLASSVPLPSVNTNASSNGPARPEVSRLAEPARMPPRAGCAAVSIASAAKRGITIPIVARLIVVLLSRRGACQDARRICNPRLGRISELEAHRNGRARTEIADRVDKGTSCRDSARRRTGRTEQCRVAAQAVENERDRPRDR